MNDFIEIYDDVMDEKWCKDIIEYGLNAIQTFKPFRHRGVQDDKSMVVSPYIENSMPEKMYHYIHDILVHHYIKYSDKYWILDKNMTRLWPTAIKFHYVKPNGGYHAWHCENATYESSKRVLAYHISLNTCKDEGDLEFLYYKKKLFPKMGRMIMWPAGITHVHRGNPMKTENKYYITGWYEYATTNDPGVSLYKEQKRFLKDKEG